MLRLAWLRSAANACILGYPQVRDDGLRPWSNQIEANGKQRNANGWSGLGMSCSRLCIKSVVVHCVDDERRQRTTTFRPSIQPTYLNCQYRPDRRREDDSPARDCPPATCCNRPLPIPSSLLLDWDLSLHTSCLLSTLSTVRGTWKRRIGVGVQTE